MLVQAPTGSGKTVIFSYLACSAQKKGKGVLILTNRTELLTQTGGTLEDFQITPSHITANSKYIPKKNTVTVAMAQTLRNRIKLKVYKDWFCSTVDLLIIDEAHLQDYNYIFDYVQPEMYVLGFSATPRRSGQMRQLALDYQTLITGPTVTELIKKDKLVPDDYYGVGKVPLDGLKYNYAKGDFSESDLFKRFDSPKLYSGVVKNWTSICPSTKSIVFCVNIEHVIKTTKEFVSSGISAKFITSKPQKSSKIYDQWVSDYSSYSGNRAELINDFKKGEFDILVNSGVLTTGFDCKDLETVVVNRATTSLTVWLQMIGRGSRTALNKPSFNILDFGDNAARLGHYTKYQNWSLWHKQSKDGGVAPVKECPECFRLIMATLKECPFCAYEYPKKVIEEVELSNITYDPKIHKAIKTKKPSQMNDDELLLHWKTKGYKRGWLWLKLGKRGILRVGKNKQWSRHTIRAGLAYVANV